MTASSAGWGQTHDVKNLFVSDGSQFTTGASENPTLTIVALALRQGGLHREADGLQEPLIEVRGRLAVSKAGFARPSSLTDRRAPSMFATNPEESVAAASRRHAWVAG